MRLSLSNQQAELIRKEFDTPYWERYWVAGKIVEAIDDAIDLENKVKNCPKHKFGVYDGRKECCILCGGKAEFMGESWTLNRKKRPLRKFKNIILNKAVEVQTGDIAIQTELPGQN